jgi:eukaryotic-like serine/threonine-protein kinase
MASEAVVARGAAVHEPTRELWPRPVLPSGMSEADRPELPLALEKTQLASGPGLCFQGRYHIEASLGEGGTGHVYRARHIALGRPVALKVLRKQHNERWVSRKRFEREAHALGQLVHPNIVSVTDSGLEKDTPFLVMELLQGVDLARRLRTEPLPVALACRYALEALDGLAFVHEQGLVHRDIKPSNIFLESTAVGERIKLLDFGLARLVTPNDDGAVTRFGEMLGTPIYMAPEQVSGEAADARTDVYAMGLVFYEMLTGRRAFDGNEMAVLQKQLAEPVPALTAPEHQPFDTLIQRATRKDPAQRFPDARALRVALAGIVQQNAGLTTRHEQPSAPARALGLTQPGAPRRAAGKSGAARRLLRAGAVLVSCLALAAIVLACSVIYLIESPGGKERRALLQRVFPSLSDEPVAPR